MESEFNFAIVTDTLSLLCFAVVIILTIVKTIKINQLEHPNIGLIGIWFFGLLSFLFRIFSFLIMLYYGFDSIQAMGEILPAAVAGSIKTGITKLLIGFPILIISIIIWGILKGIANTKIRNAINNQNNL